jgi:S-adenosylmethionine hydrolase
MKGVFSRLCPEATILDLTHDIAPQSIREAALFVAAAAPYFPPETVHTVVVDPGVGSDRRAVAVWAGGQWFVCPDNGLLTLFLRANPADEAYVLENPAFMLENVSSTFHGRDVFAPAAAHIASGVHPREFGPPAGRLVSLDLPIAIVGNDGVARQLDHERFASHHRRFPDTSRRGECRGNPHFTPVPDL